MRIKKFRIRNYKSYNDSGLMELAEGFNVFVGQNSAGKSAMVEALRLDFPLRPHRTLATVPHPGVQLNQTSELELELAFSGREALEYLLVPGHQFHVALPVQGDPLCPEGSGSDPAGNEVFLQELFGQPELTFRYVRKAVAGGSNQSIPETAGCGLYEAAKNDDTRYRTLFCQVNADRTYRCSGQSIASSHLGHAMLNAVGGRIYAFRPERTSRGKSPIGTNPVLSPDSVNLAEVLLKLQGNVSRFNRFNDLVSRVLPQVRWVSVSVVSNSEAEVLVWSVDHGTEREDLAMPLSECGTGVGQVIALLYVVISSEEPRVIVIDEPQSFLHPGAARKLVEVLSEFPRHQYVLTTHSPSIVSAANPSTLTIVENQDGESRFVPIDPQEAEDMRRFLAGVGARLSDVFGADRILWVEGPTEELSFPKIVKSLLGRPLSGTAILGVKNTGDLEGKHARSVFEIYQRLSSGQGLLPPAVGFVFDREGRSKQVREDLAKQSGGMLRFLKRRLYENYLLNPDAVAAVIGSIPDFAPSSINADDVTAWMETHRKEKKYWKDRDAVDEGWQREIHAAKFLADLFSNLSEGRHEYRKTEHSVALTEWLLENTPQDLEEVADMLRSILDIAVPESARS